MSERSGLWIYSIIENRGVESWDCRGIHGTSPVFSIAAGDFAAVVSEEPIQKYPLVRDFLIAHQRVNETVMKTQPVLPVKFCTIAEEGPESVQEILTSKAAEFRKKLSEVSDKDEFGLRVRWRDLDGIFREIGASNETVRREKEQILSLPPEKRRAELIEIGHRVQRALEEEREVTAEALMEALTPLAVETKRNKTLGDAMVLNAAFLVEKARQQAFDRAVERLDQQYGARLHSKYVGPVPPFNFVEIVIEWRSQRAPRGESRHVSAG